MSFKNEYEKWVIEEYWKNRMKVFGSKVLPVDQSDSKKESEKEN